MDFLKIPEGRLAAHIMYACYSILGSDMFKLDIDINIYNIRLKRFFSQKMVVIIGIKKIDRIFTIHTRVVWYYTYILV